MPVEEHPGSMDLACLFGHGRQAGWVFRASPAGKPRGNGQGHGQKKDAPTHAFICQTQPQLIPMVVPFDSVRLPGDLTFILVAIGDCHNGEVVDT